MGGIMITVFIVNIQLIKLIQVIPFGIRALYKDLI